MNVRRSTFVWIAGAIIAGILLGLAGWYVFISRQTAGVERTMAARGFFDSIPNIGGIIGSTAHNLGSFIGISGQKTSKNDVIGSGGILDDGTVLVNGMGETVGDAGATDTAVYTGTTPQTPTLWQLSRTPSANIALMGTSSVLFVDRGTGHVYRGDAMSGSIERMSNTLIPQSFFAAFTDEGVLLQHFTDAGTVATFSGIIASSSTTTLRGNYLEEGIVDIAARTDFGRIVYLVPDHGGIIALITDHTCENARRLWSSTLRGWNAFLPATSTAFFTQHAAAGIDGSAYRVNVVSGEVQLAYRGVGLSAVPAPTGGRMIVSTSQVGTLSTIISDGLFATTTPIDVRTLAEKCVWNPADLTIAYCAVPSTIPRQYPDEWYRGEFHSADTWWRIDTTTGKADKLFDPAEFGVTLDILHPSMNALGTHIAFLDAKTLTPWVVRIHDYEENTH